MPILWPGATPTSSPDPRLHPADIVRILSPHLTARRRRRIDRVVRQRLLSVTVVLENLHDPHNGAAALRSSEALGLVHVHVISPAGPFSYSRKVTQSADKWLNIYVHRDTASCLSLLQGWGYACWAATPPALGSAPNHAPVEVTRPVALVFGNEHVGLSPEALQHCGGRFHVPMHGFSESLNLSVSVALGLHDVTRRRRVALGRTGDLPPRAATQLKAAYYAGSVRHVEDVLLRGVRCG